MEYFVDKHSIVRRIWGKGDTILLIFAGASAEFAVNKAVDWLYYTGKLPADPLGRLFSTVEYARQIVFSDLEEAYKAIDKMAMIHAAVESKRGYNIPDWAYRDVLFMLIHYSISSFEVLERQLTSIEKEEICNVFLRMGTRMGISDLPSDFTSWQKMRKKHLQQNIQLSEYSIDLYKQYKKHLGTIRYKILLESQILVVPEEVNKLLSLGNLSLIRPVLGLYKISRALKLDWLMKSLIFPSAYQAQIKELDKVP